MPAAEHAAGIFIRLTRIKQSTSAAQRSEGSPKRSLLSSLVFPARLVPSRAIRRGPCSTIASHRKCNATPLEIDVDHRHLNDIADLHDIARIFHKSIRHGGHMHKTVIVHADVDEGAKSRDIRHDPLKLHAYTKIFDALNGIIEVGRLEFGARIPPGLFKLLQNVGNRRDSKALVGVVGRTKTAQEGRVAHEFEYALATCLL